MPTPTTEQIRQKAWELYFADNPDFASDANIPEDHELKEEGYWNTARNTLMGTSKLESLVQEEATAVDADAEAAEIAVLREKQKEINAQIDAAKAAEVVGSTEAATSQDTGIPAWEEFKKQNPIEIKQTVTETPKEETVNPLINEQPSNKLDGGSGPSKTLDPTPSNAAVPKAKKVLGPHITITEDEPSKLLMEKKIKMSNQTTSKKKILPKAATETSTLQAANSNLVALFSEITETLRKGIDVGNTNMPQGLMSMMLLADFLHGGAYAAPLNELPYYLSNKANCKFWAGPDVTNFGIPVGLSGALLEIFGSSMATEVHKEIIENSNVPHVFPKLISDQVYAKFMTMVTWLTTTGIFTTGVTNVATLVKTGGEAVKNIGQGLKAAEEGAAAETKAVSEALTSLLPLVVGA